MKELKKMTMEELSFLSKEEMEQIPPQDFGVFVNAESRYRLDALTWETWDKLTYSQLSHMSANVFSLLKEDIIQRLIDKFKDNQEIVIINKNINGKTVPVQVLLVFTLERAKELNKEMKKMINESFQIYQKHKGKNVEDIPESDIMEILMLKRVDEETIQLLKQFDTLPYLPYLVQPKYILHKFQLNKYHKIVKEYLRSHPEQFVGYRIQKHTYYRYEDIIKVLATQ